ncbi:MAG: hypothetical protein MI919_13815, partial [Holophagales bacterium]|nr:hypothetical protein [Holophagales bacterium]
MKRFIIPLCLFALLQTNAWSYDAVSAPNGKAALSLGTIDGDGSINLSGSYSMPVGEWFGAQFDGVVGQLDKRGV